MILLDPDLEPDTARLRTSAKRSKASLPPGASHRQQMPSVRSLTRFLKEAQAHVKLAGTVTVLLTSDAAIRGLNRRFRGKDKATDVLSFPTAGPIAAEMAGDLAISIPTARRQAAAQGHTLATEIRVLIVHGLLHLAGFDHESDTGQMARRERLLRGRLRLPQGLIDRSGQASAGMKTAARGTSMRRSHAGTRR
jgi:probable rRNA maturation factor